MHSGPAVRHRSRLRFLVLGLLFALASSGLPAAAQAQGAGPTVLVSDVEPPQTVTPETGGLPGLLLRATFSLMAADGTVMKSEIENATLRLGGAVYSSKFSKLETEQSVVLLMDTSGTLSTGRAYNDFRAVRDSLSRSLEGAPESAKFALIPFADRAPTAVEFTSDRERITNALKGLRPEYGKPACLNDGLYEAIAKLSNAPGRRAVIAITASADACATRSTQMVVDFANQNRVDLYGLGIEGYTSTRQELDAFTLPTGGFSEARSVSEAGFSLDNLMAMLANQWQAVWVVYPSEGAQTGEINVKLPDGTVVTGSLPFVSDRSFARPPSVAVAGTAQSTLGGVRFNLDIVNPERIAAIDVNLISKLTGRSVYEEQLTEVTDSILLPADNLTRDGDYSLVLTALDDQGQVLSQAAPAEFRYTPLAPSLAATVQEWPTAGTPYFVISVAVQNLEGIANYRLWLEDEQGGAPMRGTQITLPVGQALHLPVKGVKSGSYVVRVQALDQNEQLLIESSELKVAYRAPGVVQRIVASVQGSTVAALGVCMLGGLAIAGLAVLAWFVVPRRRRGERNVELMLPEKARRPQVSAEPVRPPAASPSPAGPTPARPAPPPQEHARPQPPRPAPPAREPAPVQAPQPSPEPARPAAAPQAAVPLATEALARIRVTEPRITAFQAEIRRSPYRIGRAPDNEGVLPVPGTSGVSGHHCVIRYADGRWTVQDDQSKFGTTVNGQPIAKGQPFDLQDGAVLGLGPNIRMEFRIVSGPGHGAPS
jgi:pSer/pThr/pTyr-binding forkhead associated (FHA) protein